MLRKRLTGIYQISTWRKANGHFHAGMAALRNIHFSAGRKAQPDVPQKRESKGSQDPPLRLPRAAKRRPGTGLLSYAVQLGWNEQIGLATEVRSNAHPDLQQTSEAVGLPHQRTVRGKGYRENGGWGCRRVATGRGVLQALQNLWTVRWSWGPQRLSTGFKIAVWGGQGALNAF